MDLRDFALPHLRATRKAAADLLAVIHKRRLDQGDLDPQSFKADTARTEVACGLLTLRNALGKLPKGFMAFERFLPAPMTEAEAEALIKRGLDDPDPYGWREKTYPYLPAMTPEEKRRTKEEWIKGVRDLTKPIPDARPMLDGDEFLDADEAWELLNGVYLDLTTAGFQRHDETTPLKVEAEVVKRLRRGIELLDQFEEHQAGDKPDKAPAVEDQGRKGKRGTKKTKTRKIDVAITLVVRTPELDDAEIARQARCTRSYLSRNKEYQRHADMARQAAARQQRTTVYDARSGQVHPTVSDPS